MEEGGCAGGGSLEAFVYKKMKGQNCCPGHPSQQPAPNTNLWHHWTGQTRTRKPYLTTVHTNLPTARRASTLNRRTAFLKQTRLPGWASSAKDHRRTCAGMSFTAGEGKPVAEGNTDGSTGHGDQHNNRLKIDCARRGTTARNRSGLATEKFLNWGKCRETPERFNLAGKAC